MTDIPAPGQTFPHRDAADATGLAVTPEPVARSNVARESGAGVSIIAHTFGDPNCRCQRCVEYLKDPDNAYEHARAARERGYYRMSVGGFWHRDREPR